MTTDAPPTNVWVRPWMYPKQEAALFSPHRFAIIEASTKAGKTVGCIMWLLEQALLTGQPGRTYWWIAPVYPQAAIAYNRMKRGLRGPDGTSPLVVKEHDGDLKLTLVGDVTIEFRSGEKPDNLYGENVFAAVLDEVTRMREEAWHAIRSTLTATNGPARMIGNVKGKKNWAYRIARRAQQGSLRGWHYAKITAADAVAAGVIDAEEVEAAREELPDVVFQQLYDAEAADDEGNPFGIGHIEACLTLELSTLPTVAWGWDLARKHDWTVGIGLDIFGKMTKFTRFQFDWETTHQRILAESEGATHALVDATGVGDEPFERLQRVNAIFEPYVYSGPSKQRLMESLAVAIQGHKIGIWLDPEEYTRNELESFEYEFTRTGVRYSAPEGMFDDCVNGLALAVKAWMQMPGRMYDPEAKRQEQMRVGSFNPFLSREANEAQEASVGRANGIRDVGGSYDGNMRSNF